MISNWYWTYHLNMYQYSRWQRKQWPYDALHKKWIRYQKSHQCEPICESWKVFISLSILCLFWLFPGIYEHFQHELGVTHWFVLWKYNKSCPTGICYSIMPWLWFVTRKHLSSKPMLVAKTVNSVLFFLKKSFKHASVWMAYLKKYPILQNLMPTFTSLPNTGTQKHTQKKCMILRIRGEF